jgi:hypothetical protein
VEPYRVIQNAGTGLLIQGTCEWSDYRVSADVTPHMVAAAGIAARVQGMRRYYGLLLCDGGQVRLVRVLDGSETLAEADLAWQLAQTYDLELEVVGNRLRAWVDGRQIFEVLDREPFLESGAVALVCQEGRTATSTVTVQPV